MEIIKPLSDSRNYYGGKLDNSIKYILINDTNLKKSYVSVCVKTGTFNNPTNYEGLAHFLEHMLFMGSQKYPDEKYYFEKVAQYGGYTNAYTSTSQTVYYFNVFDNGLNEILDIFSRFFIDPLFNPNSIAREMKAVDNEHKKNINNDEWKKYQLSLYLANDKSPINTFGTGSLQTLNKPDIRDKLIEFYNNYYTSDNLSISIASSKTFDEIKNMINNTFGQIPFKNAKLFEISKPFYTENNLKKFHYQSTANIYELIYIFEIPKKDDYLYTKDYELLSYILLNKSDKSIYYHLKNIGYLTSLLIDISEEGIFNITFKLTPNGFNNIIYIESVLFSYFYQINNLNLNDYAKYYEKVLDINFNCLEKIDTETLCNKLAVNHFYYNTNHVYKGSYIIQPKTTQDYKTLFNFINSKNYIKIIVSQDYYYSSLKYKKLKYYNGKYSHIIKEPINIPYYDNYLDFLNALFRVYIYKNNYFKKEYEELYNNIKNKCCFDLNNAYFNAKPILINQNEIIPYKISNNIYYGFSSDSKEPISNIYMEFSKEGYFNNINNYIKSNIWTLILNFLINTIMYKPLELCYNVNFYSQPSTSSINIEISAINDKNKLNMFMTDLINFLLKINIDNLTDTYLNSLIINYKNKINNLKYLTPANYSQLIISQNSYNTEYNIKDIINECDNISPNDIRLYAKELFNNSMLTIFIYGNILESELVSLFNKTLIPLNNNLYKNNTLKELNNFNIKHPNKEETSTSLIYYYPVNYDNILLMYLTVNYLSSDFFDNLRTKKQLGYLVNMSFTNIQNKYYIVQRVQSNQSIKIIEDSIEEFNNNIKLREDIFKEHLNTLKNQLEEKDISINNKYTRYLDEIGKRKFNFNRREELLLKLNSEKITLEILTNFIKLHLTKNRLTFIVRGN